jgi:2'-5' RNA ligase
VRYLGSVSETVLEALQVALVPPLADLSAPHARLRGLGVFPNWQRPRVLWAGVDCAALNELAATVEAAVVALGCAPEPRPFHPHVTLGRVDVPRHWSRLESLLRAHASDDFGAGPLPELIALRSDLRPGGALYTKLWAIPFRG